MGAAIGSIIPGVGTAIGSAVGAAIGWVSTLFKTNKQPWSGLNGTDKGNLIQGLILEAIYVKSIVTVEPVKGYVVNVLQTSNPQIVKSNNADFWSANGWAAGRVVGEVDKYNKMVELVNRIVNVSTFMVGSYEISKNNSIAVAAIFKMKKGQQPTAEEKVIIGDYLKRIKATERAKSLKEGQNIGDVVAGTGRG
jgi:hypothetical protein